MRKILAILLALVLALSLTTVAWATEGEATASDNGLPTAVDGVITLTSDVTLSKEAVINDAVSINGDGYTITGSVKYHLAADKNGETREVTVSDVHFKAGTANSGVGLSVTGTTPGNELNVTVKVEKCTFDQYAFGVGVFSHANKVNLQVSGCTFNCMTAVNLNRAPEHKEHPADNTVTFTGNTVNGDFAVQAYGQDQTEGSVTDNKYYATVEDFTSNTNAYDAYTSGSPAQTVFFVSSQEELNTAISAASSKKIVLLNSITVSVPGGRYPSQGAIELTKSITIDGNGHTITANNGEGGGFAANSGNTRGEYHVINITGGTVTLKNLKVDGSSVARSGINVWTDGKDGKTVEAVLTDVTSRNNTTYGVTAMGSSVTLNNVTTSGNTWGGVNADTRGSAATSLTVNGGTFGEKNSLYVEKNSTATGFVKVEIKGGTFTGAVSVANSEGTDKDVAGATLTISGGTFKDESTKKEINNYLASGVKLNSNGTVVKKTSSGGSSRPAEGDTVTSADTFDAGVALYAGLALTSALGAAYVTGKRR